MKLKVIVERKQTGCIVVDLPDEKWESTSSDLVRRKRVKDAAAKALENGGNVEWWEVEEITPTTAFAEMKEES